MSEINKVDNVVTYKPGKDWVAANVNGLKTELNELIRELPQEIIIDLSGAEMVDSLGIGVIIATFNSMKKIGGTIKVINASPDIFLVLQTIHLNRHFKIIKTDH